MKMSLPYQLEVRYKHKYVALSHQMLSQNSACYSTGDKRLSSPVDNNTFILESIVNLWRASLILLRAV